MSIRRNQIQYGTLWGAAAFLVGIVAVFIVTPPDLLQQEKWRTAAWLYLNANGVSVAGSRALGVPSIGSNGNLIEATGGLQPLYLVPPLLVTLGGVLTGESLRYTTRPLYIVQNCAGVIVGYLGAGLATIVISGARPAVAIVILLGGLLGGALFIGSTIANRFTGALPVLGLTTLGGLAVIGFVVILGGLTVITALLPIFAVALGGTLIASVLLFAARSV